MINGLLINISSQAMSWQMRRLEKMGLVKRNVVELNVKYSLDETIYITVNQFNMLLDNAAGRIPSL